MQTDLRLILLAIGAVIILGIIVYELGKRKSKREDEFAMGEQTSETDPLLDGHDDVVVLTRSDQDAAVEAPTVQKAKAVESEILTLYVLAKDEQPISGPALAKAFKRSNLYYSEQKIFCKHKNDNPQNPVLFSVANLVEPGYFDEEILSSTLKGVALFMVAPGSADPVITFEKMIFTGRQIATYLDAELCDSQGSQMTSQTITQYKEHIKDISRKRLVPEREIA